MLLRPYTNCVQILAFLYLFGVGFSISEKEVFVLSSNHSSVFGKAIPLESAKSFSFEIASSSLPLDVFFVSGTFEEFSCGSVYQSYKGIGGYNLTSFSSTLSEETTGNFTILCSLANVCSSTGGVVVSTNVTLIINDLAAESEEDEAQSDAEEHFLIGVGIFFGVWLTGWIGYRLCERQKAKFRERAEQRDAQRNATLPLSIGDTVGKMPTHPPPAAAGGAPFGYGIEGTDAQFVYQGSRSGVLASTAHSHSQDPNDNLFLSSPHTSVDTDGEESEDESKPEPVALPHHYHCLSEPRIKVMQTPKQLPHLNTLSSSLPPSILKPNAGSFHASGSEGGGGGGEPRSPSKNVTINDAPVHIYIPPRTANGTRPSQLTASLKAFYPAKYDPNTTSSDFTGVCPAQGANTAAVPDVPKHSRYSDEEMRRLFQPLPQGQAPLAANSASKSASAASLSRTLKRIAMKRTYSEGAGTIGIHDAHTRANTVANATTSPKAASLARAILQISARRGNSQSNPVLPKSYTPTFQHSEPFVLHHPQPKRAQSFHGIMKNTPSWLDSDDADDLAAI